MVCRGQEAWGKRYDVWRFAVKKTGRVRNYSEHMDSERTLMTYGSAVCRTTLTGRWPEGDPSKNIPTEFLERCREKQTSFSIYHIAHRSESLRVYLSFHGQSALRLIYGMLGNNLANDMRAEKKYLGPGSQPTASML